MHKKTGDFYYVSFLRTFLNNRIRKTATLLFLYGISI